MFKLLKNGYCYAPQCTGKKDILIAYDKIYKMEESISESNPFDMEIFDCSNQLICPGFIDQHLHITGGGGEEGTISRVPEIMLGEIIEAGISTVVGLLGIDAITRNVSGLLAKARSLEEEGLTTFIYTGSYGIPTATLTGKAITDLALIDKVVGIGEIAISDYRSTNPSIQQLTELAWEAKAGALIGKKAGVLHIHVGDGKRGLDPLMELVKETDYPIKMFVPTHVNRNKNLFEQALTYYASGGNIDLTAGEKSNPGYCVPDALEQIFTRYNDLSRVTVSSDGNGSIPSNGNGSTGVGKVKWLFQDIIESILNQKIPMEIILGCVTTNVAKLLGLYPQKGCLQPGSDADILVLNKKDMSLEKMFVNGQIFVEQGKAIKKGRYEV